MRVRAHGQHGQFTAFINRCPHLGTALGLNPEGSFMDAGGTSIVCRTHVALFRPEDGLCTAGPCMGEHLIRIPVHVRGDHVIMGNP